MTKKNGWFTVDKEGLAALLERKGKAWAVLELLQNAWDTDATKVEVELYKSDDGYMLSVSDNSTTGFTDLSHAFTLFAPSEKKTEANLRGRFNLGEKLVLAIANWAFVTSTTGTIWFEKDGTRKRSAKPKRESGSVVNVCLRMNAAEVKEALQVLHCVIVPVGKETVINGQTLRRRDATMRVMAELPTEVAGADGVLRRTRRSDFVEFIRPVPLVVPPPKEGFTPMLYELGLPLAPMPEGFPWDVNVHQKVPTSMERDSVSPAYIRRICSIALNHGFERITREQACMPWAREAAGSTDVSPAATKHLAQLRFGERRAAFDPSDLEANHRATALGYTVVHGSSLSAEEWENVRKAEAIPPAGKVAPTPKPFGPEGRPLVYIDPAEYSPGMTRVVRFAKTLADRIGVTPRLLVQVANSPWWGFRATYSKLDGLILNVGTLGYDFFDAPKVKDVVDLLVHEFGHEYEANHLAEAYHKAITSLAGRAVELALMEPAVFTLKGE